MITLPKLKAAVFRYTNVAILTALIVLLLTGLHASVFDSHVFTMSIHRIGAWTIVGLIPFKLLISLRSIKRGPGKRFDRNIVLIISLIMAGMALTILGTGLMWTWRIGPQRIWFRLTPLWWHWMLALILYVPLALHVWRRWPRPKQADFTTRRAFFRTAALASVGVVGWLVAETLAEARSTPENPRRKSGSRLEGEFTGNAFPITSEPIPTVNVGDWALTVTGAVQSPFTLTYDDLLAQPATSYDPVLDCTTGWYTNQAWGGVMLTDLLQQAGMVENPLAVRVTSITGYSQVYTMQEVREMLLSTHVSGEVLSVPHGFPARVIVPSRRGWFWVKWVTGIVVHTTIGEVLAQPFTIR